MSFDLHLLSLVITITGSWLVAFGVARWLRSRDVTSVHARDGSLESVSSPTLSSFKHSGPIDLGNGLTELRPAWNMRLFAPLLALFILLGGNTTGAFNAIGMSSPTAQVAVYTVLGLLFGYFWSMLLFQQRVVWGNGVVAYYGLNMTREVRALDDLIDIQLHHKRPILVARFTNQKPLHIPMYMSHRDVIISMLQDAADTNVNNGMIVPMTILRRQLGN
ncbi:hypothetical protein [Shimia abyssi]|uniref:Uncharacterized protein n=1 Tax=Shimia abyssi TaxID=1662395 RepID=A0A2P8F9J2_9RHOB|nr:hypothetical protein [Shimia abyssi]PSL18389.1 hypothetical protein CLV88_111135 [Shimia abyssi]